MPLGKERERERDREILKKKINKSVPMISCEISNGVSIIIRLSSFYIVSMKTRKSMYNIKFKYITYRRGRGTLNGA